jgi:hypothetical protein
LIASLSRAIHRFTGSCVPKNQETTLCAAKTQADMDGVLEFALSSLGTDVMLYKIRCFRMDTNLDMPQFDWTISGRPCQGLQIVFALHVLLCTPTGKITR